MKTARVLHASIALLPGREYLVVDPRDGETFAGLFAEYVARLRVDFEVERAGVWLARSCRPETWEAPASWSAGERLFATSLNDVYEVLE